MKSSIVCAAACLMALATPAMAEDTGFYLGAGAGQATVKIDDFLGFYGANFDEADTGFKVFGGYKFLPWMGVEAAYLDGGSPSAEAMDGDLFGRASVDVQSFTAAAVFALPIGDRFELFVKPGFAYWRSKASVYIADSQFVYADFSEDDDDSAFFIGGGAGFNFSDHFGIRLEYEWFEVTPKWDEYEEEFVQELDASASFVSASFVYRF